MRRYRFFPALCLIRRHLKAFLAFAYLFFLSACSTSIPKEVVELSYKIEQDMTKIEQAYIELVHQHIAILKTQRENYLYNVWVPELLDDWIKQGKLIEMAEGKVIYDDKADDFIETQKVNRLAQLNGIKEWALVATEEIERKRKELLSPLEQAESDMIIEIQNNFSMLIQANQTITAHLNSIRKSEEVQNQLLEGTGINQLGSQITQKLDELTKQTQLSIGKVESSKGIKP